MRHFTSDPDSLRAFISDIPDDLPLQESRELFLTDLGIEYTGDKTWWSRYSDEELASAIGTDLINGTPATPEEVETFKVKEKERLRKLAVWALRQAYFFAWVDGLRLDELRKEVKRVSKQPLTSWELRTWAINNFRERLKQHASEYGVRLNTEAKPETTTAAPTTTKQKRTSSRTKKGATKADATAT
jgi:hypothetical protein